MTMTIPSAADIANSGNAYDFTISLPPPLEPVQVDLSLDDVDNPQNILIDGPDVYEADTSDAGIAGVQCVITGSADGIFTDINTTPLTGSLTIDIDSVEDSPTGSCTLLKKPTEPCAITVNLDAGSPL